MKDDLTRIKIKPNMAIREAIRTLNENTDILILLVVSSEEKLVGTVTDGDVRRGLLNDIGLDEPVRSIMCREPKTLPTWERDNALDFMNANAISQVILVNEDGKVEEVIGWKNVKTGALKCAYKKKTNPVFILAGGKGTRLDVFTKIIPKPLIPIGEKPMLEHLFNRFQAFGFKKFYVSVNYKADMIKMYFRENPDKFEIEYVEEKEFLGTAGSLALIKGKVNSSLVVSNCDVIFDINYHELLDWHIAEKNDATVVGVVKHFKIPYGVVKMGNGELIEILEKPEYDFLVNAGLYVLEPDIINIIEPGEQVDMTDLLQRAKKKGFKVKVYPVTNNWRDIGEWNEYSEALAHYERIRNGNR